MRPLLSLRSQRVATSRDLDPVHANDLPVYHESQSELHVALVRGRCIREEIAETAFTPLENAWRVQ